MARQTTFVESGPLFIVSEPWIEHVIPFPEDFGMGWGLWLLWQDLQEHGCTLGILDCITVKHSRPAVREYSLRPEKERLRRLLGERSLQKSQEGQRTLMTWRVWEAEPSWKSRTASCQ